MYHIIYTVITQREKTKPKPAKEKRKMSTQTMKETTFDKYTPQELTFIMVNRNHHEHRKATAKAPTWKHYLQDVRVYHPEIYKEGNVYFWEIAELSLIHI